MIPKTVLVLSVAVGGAILFVGCGGQPRQGLARGAELYDTCTPCHGPDGAGNAVVGAPAIAGLSKWYVEGQLGKYRGNIRGTHPDDVHGARMRPMARSLNRDGDVASVAEYVSKMPTRPTTATLAGGDPAAGAVRYNSICMVCHGPDGRGNEALSSPSLIGQSDWYMLTQLKNFKSGLRGAHPEDVTGAQMRAMAMTLEDEKAMLDVIAFIKTLK